MKVLCLSLLRLGDIFMQIPLFNEMKRNQKIVHLLIHKQFAPSEQFLLRFVDQVSYFDRETYQRSCGESQFNILFGFQQIKDLIAQLNLESYDSIYNLTNTRLSAVLMGAIDADEKKGFQFIEGQFQATQNAWLRYLNTHFSFPNGSLFHYTEILGHAFDISVSPLPIKKRLNQKSPLILLQCFTSDQKKNWPLIQFHILAQTLQVKYPMALVRVIAAPSEVNDLKRYFKDEEIWTSDIETAYELLKQADLFIGLDTSIKHLAALAQIPVVEINLGSADARKTGAFLQGVHSWSASIACAPCSHDQKCSQVSQKCAESLEVATVLNHVDKALRGQAPQKSGDEWADRLVWDKYLSKNSLHLYEAGMHLKISSAYIQNTIHFSKWQDRLEMALVRNNRLAQSKEINKNDIADFLSVAKEILSAKLDKGSYFLRLIDALLWTGQDGAEFFKMAELSIKESGELIKFRKELIKGSKDAGVTPKIIRQSFSSLANG